MNARRLGSLLVVLVLGGCGAKVANTLDGPCDGEAPPPECSLECDPSGGDPMCPAGFHCSVTGSCTAECTAGGSECSAGQVCNGTGFCVEEMDCPSVDFMATPTTPTVHLLLDQSGSMTATYGATDRWNAMRDALIDQTTGVVATLQSKVVFGATLYSGVSQSVNGTQMGVAPCPRLASTASRALNNFTAIQTLLQNASPIEDTPTAESIDAIRADFAANPPMTGSPPIIVLATDGLPDTCADADPPNGTRQAAANDVTVVAAQSAYAAGIRLFFLFVGDATEAGTHPQRMANAGVGQDPLTGTAPFYEANNPAQLTAAFNSIINGVLSCELDLDGNVDTTQANTGTVTLNGMQLVHGMDWELVDSNTIRLIGNACTTLTSSPSPTVSANFPCGAVIL